MDKYQNRSTTPTVGGSKPINRGREMTPEEIQARKERSAKLQKTLSDNLNKNVREGVMTP